MKSPRINSKICREVTLSTHKMSLMFLLVASLLPCNGAEMHSVPHEPSIHDQQNMIRVRIKNGNKMRSFLINSDATTSELYRNARWVGIMDPAITNVLWEYSGRVIPDDPSVMLLDMLPPPPSLDTPHQTILSVFSAEKIIITVHISNGSKIWSFTTHCGMTVDALYQHAVDMGIMENADQFMLQFEDDESSDNILESDPDPSMPSKILLNVIDPLNPNQLKLFVSPVPEGLLLFAMF